jgi:TldD protein
VSWSRRDLLRALAATSAAPLVAPLLSACGAGAPRAAAPGGPVGRPLDEVRAQLRETVTALATRFEHAAGLVTVRHRGGAAVDGGERTVDRHTRRGLILTVSGAGRRFELGIDDLSATAIDAAAQELRRRAAAVTGEHDAPELGAAQDLDAAVKADPRTAPLGDWLAGAAALYRRARRVGGSRIVYRGAYLTVDDTDTVYVGRGRDLRQRVVRTRAGVLFVTQTGAVPTAEEAVRTGTIGLEALELGDPELDQAAERVLELMTPRALASGDTDLVLDPTVAGILAHRGIGEMMRGSRWVDGTAALARGREALGSASVTVVDDPTVAGAFGSYAFDDQGVAAAPTVLIDGGRPGGPITDTASAAALGIAATGNGRRGEPLGPVAPHLSNIAFAPGAGAAADLIAGVDSGYVLEGGLAARLDPGRWRLWLRAARAREIAGGKLSGRVYGDIELEAEVPALLAAVRGASSGVERHATWSEEVAMSAGGPHLLTRGAVRGGP